jgi:ribosomal protein S18 acetylase RimI-like enzyme
MRESTGDRVLIRPAEPADYPRVHAVIDDWWGGRPMAAMLPKLFFVHFRDTSFVAEEDDGSLAGFLCGFRSQTFPDEAYIHFVGVDPARRTAGLGRALYERFFEAARANGRSLVRAVTSPVNEGSIRFHQQMGFDTEYVAENYDGSGEDRVLFVKRL